MRMTDITYQTEPVEPEISDGKTILNDAEQDAAIKQAQTRIANLRKRKSDINDAKKKQLNQIDVEIQQAILFRDSLKANKARKQAGKVWF